jgi:hypothetical protein
MVIKLKNLRPGPKGAAEPVKKKFLKKFNFIVMLKLQYKSNPILQTGNAERTKFENIYITLIEKCR